MELILNRSAFPMTEQLQLHWRNFFGKSNVRFPTVASHPLDSEAALGDGRRVLLLLILQRVVKDETLTEALVGYLVQVEEEQIPKYQRVSLDDLKPVLRHGGQEDEPSPGS